MPMVLYCLASTPKMQRLCLLFLAQCQRSEGVIIHPGKTEYMVIQPVMADNTITYKGASIPLVDKFRYLGTTITYNLDDSLEVCKRIGMGKAALWNCKYLSSQVSLDTKIQLVRSLVLTKTLYSSTTLSLKATDIKCYDAFGRTIWRTLLGIKWSDFITR